MAATATITERPGSELFTTGVFGVDLVTRGRLIPYVVGGGGVAHSAGKAPTAALLGEGGMQWAYSELFQNFGEALREGLVFKTRSLIFFAQEAEQPQHSLFRRFD